METTLLGLELPNVLQQLKKMLVRKGFVVQTIPTSNPVIIAFKEGNWLRNAKQLVFEISCVDNNVTRIDITAIVDKRKNSQHVEEVIEGNFASMLYNSFKKIMNTPYGI